MAKEHDPYEPCPCDSGKKFKFCCYKVRADIERVQRMMAADQVRLAEQVLDKLVVEHPDNLWVRVTRATLAFSESRYDEAVAECDKALSREPDHPSALLIRAMAHVQQLGYERTRAEVQKAFQKGALKTPRHAAILATIVAERLSHRPMARRAHLELALALSVTSGSLDEDHAQAMGLESRERLMELLERFEENSQIPHCLRSPWRLEELPEELAGRREAVAARKLIEVGCFEAAGKLLEELTKEYPDEARLWFNAGLSYAWAARDKQAISLLRRAAELADDFETAVEWETLAQVLGWVQRERLAESTVTVFRLRSADEALRRLAEAEHCLATDFVTVGDDEPDGASLAHVSWLDQPFSNEWMSDPDAPPEKVPWCLATLMLVKPDSKSADAEERPVAPLMLVVVSPVEGVHQVLDDIRNFLGDLIEETVGAEQSARRILPQLFLRLVGPQTLLPASDHGACRRKVRDWARRFVEEVWLKTPQEELGGATPEEAAGREELRVALAAAVYVLDTFCLVADYPLLDVDQLRSRLQLPPRAKLQLPPNRTPSDLNALQLQRLDVEALSDEMLSTVFRWSSIRDWRVVRPFCEEALRRNLFSPRERDELRQALLNCYVELEQREKALQLLEEAQQASGSGVWLDQALHRIRWRQLAIWALDRLRDKENLKRVLVELWRDREKVPEVAELVLQAAERNKLSGPWDDEKDETTGVVGRETESGIWVPSGADEEELKKLWLPGDD